MWKMSGRWFFKEKKTVLELILCLEISEWNLIENCLENVNFLNLYFYKKFEGKYAISKLV